MITKEKLYVAAMSELPEKMHAFNRDEQIAVIGSSRPSVTRFGTHPEVPISTIERVQVNLTTAVR